MNELIGTCDRHGVATPYYLIDEAALGRNLAVVDEVRERSGAKVVLALKCFSTWGLFDLIRDHVDGTTSSSLYEARLGREELGKEVHAYSVAFSGDEARAVGELADKVIFNSIAQLDAFADQVGEADVGLRVNPGISYSPYDLADPARRYSRLGVIDDDALSAIVDRVTGLMCHFNCENNDVDNLATAVESIMDRYAKVLESMDWISLGGGISFTSAGYPLERFCDVLRTMRDRFSVQVYLEPGEAVVHSSGELVTTVLDVVHNDIDIAIVDASVEAHMLDHLIYRTTPGLTAPAPGGHRTMIAGNTCLAADVFGEFSVAAPLTVGNEVRFADAAGYTMVKTNWFNGVTMPSIAVRRLDGTVQLIRQFDYHDFKRSLS